MRLAWIATIALALGACGSEQRAEGAGCTLHATADAAWRDAPAHVIAVSARGETCAQASARFSVRTENGREIFARETPLRALMLAGDAIPRADAARFLASWAAATTMRSNDLPAWRDGAAGPGEGGAAIAHPSPLARDAYEALRAQRLPTLCFADGVDTSACIVIRGGDAVHALGRPA